MRFKDYSLIKGIWNPWDVLHSEGISAGPPRNCFRSLLKSQQHQQRPKLQRCTTITCAKVGIRIAILEQIEYDLKKTPNVFLIHPICSLLQDGLAHTYTQLCICNAWRVVCTGMYMKSTHTSASKLILLQFPQSCFSDTGVTIQSAESPLLNISGP